MTRTTIVAAALLSLVACTAPADDAASQGAATTSVNGTTPTTRLRIMTSNLTSGNLQSYDPGDGARILQGLAPDVALMQEFNFGDGSDTAIRSFVDSTFGPSFSYARQVSGNEEIPNGVVSRYPIISAGEWKDPQTATRGFAWAQIDIPGDHDLWAISVHLLTSNAGRRASQASTLVSQIHAQVPAGDYVTIGGDFNTKSRTEQAVRTLGGVFQVSGPFPADNRNNFNTSANRSEPYDWVLVSPDLDALKMPVVIGAQTFANGLVFDSRVYTPLADVAPVRQGDSGSANMQHMAVVRDFALPVAPSTPDSGTP